MVNYTSHSYNLSDTQLSYRVEKFFDDKGTTLVFEPAVTLRLGYEGVKVQLQYSHTSFSYDTFDWDPVDANFYSLGVQFLISRRFARK